MQCVGARRVPHQPIMMNLLEALSTIKQIIIITIIIIQINT